MRNPKYPFAKNSGRNSLEVLRFSLAVCTLSAAAASQAFQVYGWGVQEYSLWKFTAPQNQTLNLTSTTLTSPPPNVGPPNTPVYPIGAYSNGSRQSYLLNDNGMVLVDGQSTAGEWTFGVNTFSQGVPFWLKQGSTAVTGIISMPSGSKCQSQHFLALGADGMTLSWSRMSGSVGVGTSAGPVSGSSPSGVDTVIFPWNSIGYVKQHALTTETSLALSGQGTVYAWGNNGTRVINPTTGGRYTPVQVGGLTNIKQIDGGYGHAMALRSDGIVLCWGSNSIKQCGPMSAALVPPTPVAGLTDVKSIAAGVDCSYALKADGTVWQWGSISHGQGGTGVSATPSGVHKIPNISGIVSIWTGPSTLYMLRGDGIVLGLGENESIGSGTGQPIHHGIVNNSGTADVTSPTVVTTGAGTVLNHIISGAGPNPAMLVRGTGKPIVLGANAMPVNQNLAPGLAGVKQIARAGNKGLFIGTDGRIYTENSSFTLVLEKNATVFAPSYAIDASIVASPVSSTGYNSIAIDANGKVYFDGMDVYGLFGSTPTAKKWQLVSMPAAWNSAPI